VDDSTAGQLVVRWPTDSPKGHIVMTFNETSVSISGEGGMKDNWFFELSSAKGAKLPFVKMNSKKLSCTYQNAPYAISAKEGKFMTSANAALRIAPENNSIVLDFSAR
jgi:hypothetical protein